MAPIHPSTSLMKWSLSICITLRPLNSKLYSHAHLQLFPIQAARDSTFRGMLKRCTEVSSAGRGRTWQPWLLFWSSSSADALIASWMHSCGMHFMTTCTMPSSPVPPCAGVLYIMSHSASALRL